MFTSGGKIRSWAMLSNKLSSKNRIANFVLANGTKKLFQNRIQKVSNNTCCTILYLHLLVIFSTFCIIYVLLSRNECLPCIECFSFGLLLSQVSPNEWSIFKWYKIWIVPCTLHFQHIMHTFSLISLCFPLCVCVFVGFLYSCDFL